MSNEMVLKSGKALPMGNERWEIRDNGVPVHFVDLITELRHVNGVLHVALASTVLDAGNDPIVSIASRFRMDLVVAQSLHRYLGEAIADALKPTDHSKAN